MKIILPGGTGQIGSLLARAFAADGHEVIVISRTAGSECKWRVLPWTAAAAAIDGADAVINLAGRSVNCRYNAANRKAILESRLTTTHAVGEAILRAQRPPAVWLQMSTATIYAHRHDAANNEATGILGTTADDVPGTWRFSHDVANSWEHAATEIHTPSTRQVLLRTAMVMSPDKDGVFDVLMGLVRHGLGGTNGTGRQYVSWIHSRDFLRATYWLMEHGDIAGPVNVASPGPLPNKDFMRDLRRAANVQIGLPATAWMLEVGALFLRTETELLLKSRRVVPQRLIEGGFVFEFPSWPAAARELYDQWRARQ